MLILNIVLQERLAKEWTAPIYAFFGPIPEVGYEDGRRFHAFHCAAPECKNKSRRVRRFLDKGDAHSTGNMRKHAKKCWGDDIVTSADKAPNANEVRSTTIKGYLDPSSIKAAFERRGKGKVSYLHRQHTRTETRYVTMRNVFKATLTICRAEIVRWVCESKRPFSIVDDRGFQCLMKTGRPSYYIPSKATVSRDVKQVFVNARKRIAKMLQEYEGHLNFATDAWTSPNHKAFVAITVHFEKEGISISLLLDLVEVPTSHSGLNLAIAFAGVIREFGILHKVSKFVHENSYIYSQ